MIRALAAAFCLAATPALARPISCAPIPNYSSKTYTRNWSAISEFKRATGFPKGRPGWRIDHPKPLKCGGIDAPINMQWLPEAEKKRKDAVELDCGRYYPHVELGRCTR
jgi:hypothetical protein